MENIFHLLGIDKKQFYQALRKMGKDYLKTKSQKEEWSASNPTRHYCYMVSEFIYRYVAPEGTKLRCIKMVDEIATHHYLKLPDGMIVDLTAEQFGNKEIDYSKSKGCNLMYTPYGVSKKTQVFAELMGYDK